MTLTKNNSEQELNIFLQKIFNKEPFGIIRSGDGEYLILHDKTFKSSSIWKYDGKQENIIKKELNEALDKYFKLPNFYIGISCQDCYQKIYNYYIERFKLDLSRITYANMFQNNNWKIFINYLINNNIKFYYIGPGKNKYDKLKVLDRFYIDEFLIESWNQEGNITKENLKKWIENKKESKIFCFSAGPLTKIFIPMLMEIYPNNIYLDCGSSLDLYLKGTSNRNYCKKNNKMNRLICDFTQNHIIK